MQPDSSKIYSQLIQINPDNHNLTWKDINGEKHLLVVTWKYNKSYYEPYLDSASYNTGNYEIWVTASPELKQRMNQISYDNEDQRLKELLGLPPNSEYRYFIEFWVKEDDLFRPCPDSEISDNSCQICFDDDTPKEYVDWFNQSRASRYFSCDLYEKYPWTQLGYTYDWNADNTDHIGLSEFVIKKNRDIIVNKIYTTSEYLN